MRGLQVAALALIAGGGVAALLVKEWPAITRYVKIRRM
jgi:hypothetical protein